MWMNVLKTTEDAANLQLVSTYLAASIAPVILDTPVMDLAVQVRSLAAVLHSKIYCKRPHNKILRIYVLLPRISMFECYNIFTFLQIKYKVNIFEYVRHQHELAVKS